MATDNKIASELLSQFNHVPYSDRDGISLDYFKTSEMGKKYWKDVCRRFSGFEVNPNHVLEHFCKFSDTDPNCLCKQISDIVCEEHALWESTGHIVLWMKTFTLSDWVEHMCEPNTRCDELMLFALSRIHCRHSVVHRHKQPWTTVNDEAMPINDGLFDLCEVQLVYLGEHIYGELCLLPILPAPLSAVKAKLMMLPCRQKKRRCQ